MAPKAHKSEVIRKTKQPLKPVRGGDVRRRVVRLPAGYGEFIADLKSRIQKGRVKAALAANRELIQLYWDIGRMIVERQRDDGWGKSVVVRISNDLKREFPEAKGFSLENIWRMRALYLAWTEEIGKLSQAVTVLGRRNSKQNVGEADGQNLPQAVGEIPWGHNILLLTKLKNPTDRLWYAKKSIENGWSRAVLTAQIESGLHERQGAAITNFQHTLPAPQSDLAQQVFKDPYVFDFLTIAESAQERELENALLTEILRFLLELGRGFFFVGRQFRLNVGGEDYFIDLLFYHYHLRCFIIVDLKMEPFEPEFAGKMNFYLAAVNAQMRHGEDSPPIGLILCKEHNRLVVEYALSETRHPIGVATWQLTRKLPKQLNSELPTASEIEASITLLHKNLRKTSKLQNPKKQQPIN